MASPHKPPSRGDVFAIAWPIILANASVPLLGLTDTAVIGRRGSVAELGAIALGSLIFSFVFWSFGFLRMSTTGFVAQAAGARDEPELRAVLGRALVLALLIGVVLVIVQRPLENIALSLLGESPAVEQITRVYFRARIWGAPAALCSFALMGTLIGLGESRKLLWVQLFLNGLNALLDVLFAFVFGWGAWGVALGTAIAEWASLGFSVLLVLQVLRSRRVDTEPFWVAARIFDRARLRVLLNANLDILLRTLALLSGFGWFTNQGAMFGDVVLASNHLLLQLISFSAFFLDGFAFAVESLVGKAKGARSLLVFDQAVRRSTELAVIAALMLALGITLFGGFAIDGLTDLPEVRTAARSHLLPVVLYVTLSVWAFQLDGVFLGATQTRAMRNAAFVSLLVFLGLSSWLAPRFGNQGLWAAFVGYVVVRGLSLSVLLPGLRRTIAGPEPAPASAE